MASLPRLACLRCLRLLLCSMRGVPLLLEAPLAPHRCLRVMVHPLGHHAAALYVVHPPSLLNPCPGDIFFRKVMAIIMGGLCPDGKNFFVMIYYV